MAGERKGLNLSQAKANTKKRDPKPTAATEKKAAPKSSLMDLMSGASETSTKPAGESNQSEDEDDEVLSSVASKGSNKNKMMFYVGGAGVVALVVICFLLFGNRGNNQPTQNQNTQQTPVQQEQQQTQQQQPTTDPLENMGIQDFTGNTNMTNSDVLTNPDKYVQDIYGLSTRVNYTVEAINNVADFVSYVKYRGTWGGGLELYWLEVNYKGSKYVIQIPFSYYKELTVEGIVPVKMEVLTIKGSKSGEKLTVISYMWLDDATLKTILNNKK